MVKYEKLSRDKSESTVIMAGRTQFTIEQLEKESSNSKSDFGKKLKEVEKEVEERY